MGATACWACAWLCVSRSFHLQGPRSGDASVLGDEIAELIGMADYLSVNDYEAEMIAQKTGRAIESFAPGLNALIVTLGAQGSRAYTDGRMVDVPVVPASALVDPTGCGCVPCRVALRHRARLERGEGLQAGQPGGFDQDCRTRRQNHNFTEPAIRALCRSVGRALVADCSPPVSRTQTKPGCEQPGHGSERIAGRSGSRPTVES